MEPKRSLGIGLAVATVLLASACAAGQQAATSNEISTINGANGDIGSIHLRGLVIEPPNGTALSYAKGDSATVKLVLVNVGSQPDRLVSITSPALSNWGSFASTADAAAALAPTPPVQPTRTRTAGGTAGASATGSAASPAPTSASASPTPPPAPSQSVVLPPGARVSWGTPESTGVLALLNFTEIVYPGTTIPITFRFANAGSLTMSVPIALIDSVNTSGIPVPTNSIEG